MKGSSSARVLRPGAAARLAAVGLAAALAAGGCARGPAAREAGPPPAPAAPGVAAPRDVVAATDWEAFARTASALRREINRRAEALRRGPIGNSAVELASLRLAASGRDLIEAGSLDGALETLQRAVSLDGGNGYAYLYLAYVHHVQGRSGVAAEFASNARRFLPDDPGVASELEGLLQSIRQAAAAGAG